MQCFVATLEEILFFSCKSSALLYGRKSADYAYGTFIQKRAVDFMLIMYLDIVE